MLIPGRHYNSEKYRFAFNGKESDPEWKGSTGTVYDYGFRIYDSRIGKFLSVDPLTKSYPMLTPYQFASNQPIWAIDLDGLESKVVIYDYSLCDGSNDGMVVEVVDQKKIGSAGYGELRIHMMNGEVFDTDWDKSNWDYFKDFMAGRSGIGIIGNGNGGDSPGKNAWNMWDVFNFKNLSEIFDIINIAIPKKYQGNPGPKTMDEAATDFGNASNSLIEQNNLDEKKEENQKPAEIQKPSLKKIQKQPEPVYFPTDSQTTDAKDNLLYWFNGQNIETIPNGSKSNKIPKFTDQE